MAEATIRFPTPAGTPPSLDPAVPHALVAQPTLSEAAESDQRRGFALLRGTLGINLLVHGLVRLPELSSFASSLVEQFKATPLPAPLVRAFADGLPFVEAAVGVSLLFGLATRLGAVLGALTMAALVFGTALRSDWNTLGVQMIYVVVYYVVISRASWNAFSIDTWLARRRAQRP